MTLLTVHNLTVRRGECPVVDRASFAIGEGECVGLIGPNGAGKTTLVNMLSGEMRPDAGNILFNGRDITRMAGPARVRAGPD